MSTVPIFAPDGTLGDIPAERLPDAVKAGAKPGVNVISPDGIPGVVPADRYADAVKAGAKLAPGENQPQTGFLGALGSDIKSMVQGIPSALSMALPSSDPRVMAAQMRMRSQATSAMVQNLQSEKEAGYSAPYRAAAVAGQAIGVNVPGMEQAAAQGDPGAVLGHAAAVPAVIAAAARLGPTFEGIRQGLRAMRAPTPATPTVYPGAPFPDNPGVFPGAQFPETPTAEMLQARTLQYGPRQVVDPAAGLGKIPVSSATQGPTASAQTTAPQPVTAPVSEFGSPSGISNPLHGESALTDILSRLDNQTLLKIAKSRGISVSQVQQLKPGVANPQLIRNIVADYSPDELAELSARALENSRFQGHNFGQISDEAWRTIALQTYFPDVKIPLTQLRRAALSVQGGKK